jgi:hypothetical protein
MEGWELRAVLLGGDDCEQWQVSRYLLDRSPTDDVLTVSSTHCIGAAVSSNITGPYQAQLEPFACPISQGGAIDAYGFLDDDGTRYVLYKIDGNSCHGPPCTDNTASVPTTPIMLQQVEDDGITLVGDPIEILRNNQSAGEVLVEAPALVKVENEYLLYFSTGIFSQPTYSLQIATSDTLLAKFSRAGQPLLATNVDGLIGPGSAGLNVDGSYIAFHGYASQAAVGRQRAMYTAFMEYS